MSRFILLDTGPLGLLAHPRAFAAIEQWIAARADDGSLVAIPEIADYEVRRELIRMGRARGIQRLDVLKADLIYVAITTTAMLRAAEYWAHARAIGRPTAEPAALDGDVILAAQATVLANAGHDVVVATDNVDHLSLFVAAARWQEIR